MEQLQAFKAKYPILFWICIPFVAAIFIVLFLTRKQDPQELTKPAESQDALSKVEVQKIKDQSEEEVHKAQALQNKIDHVEVTEDWYTKDHK